MMQGMEWATSQGVAFCVGEGTVPRKLPTPCLAPGCPRLGHGGRCAEHAAQRDREREQRYEATRGSAASRGYDATWRRLRLMVLRAEPLCRQCGAPATDVDHILPLARGGTNEAGNLRSLCAGCHSRKTNREDGGGWVNRRRRVQ